MGSNSRDGAAVWGAVLGAVCAAVYVEGASLAIMLSTGQGYSAMQRASMGECAERLGWAFAVLEVAGVASLLWWTWRKWLRTLGIGLVFFGTQFVLVASAFLVSREWFSQVVAGAGRWARSCLCG